MRHFLNTRSMGLDAAQGIYEVFEGLKPSWPVSKF